MEYDKKNTFVLFKNEKKNEKQPDYRGNLTDENGKEWSLAVWQKTSKKGAPFLSGKVSEPYQKPEGNAPSAWEAQREKFSKPEELPTNKEVDEPIDLSAIPF